MVMDKFSLPASFLSRYSGAEAPFGYNGLGHLVYMRTYSRKLPNGKNEDWVDTIKRVVEGSYSLQREHLGEEWSEGVRGAKVMFSKMFNMKFLPGGRSLWCMGTDVISKKGIGMALYNCAAVSTQDISDSLGKPFAFLMDSLMLGVGVGFDTRGKGKVYVHEPITIAGYPRTHIVEDTREGWVQSTRELIESYLIPGSGKVTFDYSLIREKGQELRTFGGVSSGPEPLIRLHSDIDLVLSAGSGGMITGRMIVDIMNLIGVCVVAGNVRRSAEIAFGDLHDEEFLNLKNYYLNPERSAYGWTSNNTVFADLGDDYSGIIPHICDNGEPGICWMDNVQQFSRMGDSRDYKDSNAILLNPCGEISLENYEVCNLVEIFLNRHATLSEFLETLRYAFLYAKVVTLVPIHWNETQEVVSRNRRIGCSLSGIAQFIAEKGIGELKEWCEAGYAALGEIDASISTRFRIPMSIKRTTVKPSGTISLLAGATPGVHFPISKQYIRRVRIAKMDPIMEFIKKKGYPYEPCAIGTDNYVVEIPISVCNGSGKEPTCSPPMLHQLLLVDFMQAYWADNQVSATVTFDPETERKDLEFALQFYQYRLKSISFLPHCTTAYPQKPYEPITEEEYRTRVSAIKTHVGTEDHGFDGQPMTYCDSESCTRL